VGGFGQLRGLALAALGGGHVAEHLLYVLAAASEGGAVTAGALHSSTHTPQGIKGGV
jgi:hypothetical protein